MSELVSFGLIEWGDDSYTEAQHEAAEFLQKMDWEGGVEGLLSYGGYQIFPEPLQNLASDAEHALRALRTAIDEWAAERGVEY